ncbi:MAG: class I SAM-dependent methyltransferase [Candidatus Binatia bacterium]
MTESFLYEGTELTLFQNAQRWKSYLRSILAPYIHGHVLEVGAGIGGTTWHLADLGASWVCLEPDATLAARIPETLTHHPALDRVDIHVGTLATLTETARFDTILYIDVLEHIENDAQEVTEAARHLDSGGHLVVLAPAHPFLFTPFDTQIGHYRRYNKKSLQALAPPLLRCVAIRYLDSIGLLASLGNRLVLKCSMPTAAQIALWDRWMVPLSSHLDPKLGNRVGKSVLGVWKLEDQSSTVPQDRVSI